MPHNLALSLQDVVGGNVLKAELAQTLAAALRHGLLPDADTLGIFDAAKSPRGWATAAAADPRAAVPFSALVMDHMASGCTIGETAYQA